MKLCTLHTSDKFMELMTIPFTRPFIKKYPEVEQMDIADSSLIVETQAAGAPTPAVARRMYNYMLSAVDAGADAILVTCTSVNSVTNKLKELISVPVISIEEPVAFEAVTTGKKIGILSSLATSAEPVRNTILRVAEGLGASPEIEISVAEGAFDALMNGDRSLHDDKVRKKLAEMSGKVDVIILAQLSMALVEHPEYDIPVLKLGLSGYEEAYKKMLDLTK